jgi:feruloyl esterase
VRDEISDSRLRCAIGAGGHLRRFVLAASAEHRHHTGADGGGGRVQASAPPGQGPNVFQTLPAFCRVAATLTPSSDSDIKIEVWLPAKNWNGKFQAIGNSGWGGYISYPAMARALAHGYATAATDTGHATQRASFAMGHPEKLVDFGSHAVHEMTVEAKALIAVFYSQPARRSY